MAKSAQAFRTIREVADWLGVAAHVLRFWESKFSQIKPVKRAGGRRYYRPSDMELVGGIKVLLHDRGMTIRGVKKMISDEGLDAITALSPPIDTLLEDPDVIDITPDEAWEADAAAESVEEPEGAEVPEEIPVETALDDENETEVAAQSEESPEAVAEPTPDPVAADPAPRPSAPIQTPSPLPSSSEGRLGLLAHRARASDDLVPHLAALKALRDRLALGPGQQ